MGSLPNCKWSLTVIMANAAYIKINVLQSVYSLFRRLKAMRWCMKMNIQILLNKNILVFDIVSHSTKWQDILKYGNKSANQNFSSFSLTVVSLVSPHFLKWPNALQHSWTIKTFTIGTFEQNTFQLTVAHKLN